jgi:hypothetical protein
VAGGLVVVGLAYVLLYRWSRTSMSDSGSETSWWSIALGGPHLGLRRLRQIREERRHQYEADRAVVDYRKEQSSAILGMLDRELKESSDEQR